MLIRFWIVICCSFGIHHNINYVQEDTGLVLEDTGLVQEDAGLVQEDAGLVQENDNQAYEEIYEMLEIDEAMHELTKQGVSDNIGFEQLAVMLKNGNTSGIVNVFLSIVYQYLFHNINAFRGMMLEVISIVLLGSIFIHLSTSFGNGFVSENGFYVAYLIITSILITAFSMSMIMVQKTLRQLIILVEILAPVYALAMQYLGKMHTAIGMYELITIGIFVVQIIILKFVLPMIQFYVITSMINNLNKEDTFSKLCKFVQFMVRWILKTVIIFIVGLNVIKSLIEPQMDELSKHAVSKLIASVPGGGIVSILTGTFFGAGAILKNCIGVVGILLIGLVLLIPLLKTFLLMLTAKLTAIIIQPIGEKRFVDGVETLADGMKLLLLAMGSSIVLFVLTIAIMAYASKGG